MTREQLSRLGFSRRAIGGRLARGWLVGLHRGVYATGHGALRPEGRWLAAVLACGPGAVLSHRSAAALWDLRPATRPAIDVIAPRTRGRRDGIDLHFSRCLEPKQRTEYRRIPCTTVARTLVDLASVTDESGLRRAWQRAGMLGLLDVQAFRDALNSGRGRRGAAHLRSLLAEQCPDPVTRSQLEERFLSLCRDAGLPRPEVNTRVQANGATYEVDFLWRAQRLVVKTDGWGPHRTREAFEADRRRDADLLIAGLRVVRLTWRQVTRDPSHVTATLLAIGVA